MPCSRDSILPSASHWGEAPLLLCPLKPGISRGLGPSVLEGSKEKKSQNDDGDSPSGIPRKCHGFIISEKNEGEFIMFQPVSLLEFIIDGIGHRNSIISSHQSPRIRFHRFPIFYENPPPRGQSPHAIGLAPGHLPFCLGKKTGLSKGDEKK